MTQTLANPTFGVRLVTSGDAVAVDFGGLEDSASFATSRIPTTTVAVTRNADMLTYPFAGNADPAVGMAYAELSRITTDTATAMALVLADANGRLLYKAFAADSTTISMFDGSNVVSKNALTDLATGIRKRASSWGAGGNRITGDGASETTGAFDGAMGGGATSNLGIGSNPAGGGNEWFGTIKNVKIWQTQLSDLQTLTT